MGYIENNLLTGETIIYKAKLHWILFAWPVIWLVLALCVFANASGASPASFASTYNVKPFAWILFVLALVTGLNAYITYVTSEFGLTSKRVLVKVGFIRRKSFEVLLVKVEGIQVDQGILGRILGYGSIVVSGTGGSKEPFHSICDPLTFRKKVQEQIDLT